MGKKMKPVTELQWHNGLLKYAAMREGGGPMVRKYFLRLRDTRPATIPLVALELVGGPFPPDLTEHSHLDPPCFVPEPYVMKTLEKTTQSPTMTVIINGDECMRTIVGTSASGLPDPELFDGEAIFWFISSAIPTIVKVN